MTYLHSKKPRRGFYAAWTTLPGAQFPPFACARIVDVRADGCVAVEVGPQTKTWVLPFLVMAPKAGLVYKQTIMDLRKLYTEAKRDFEYTWLDTAQSALEKASRIK